MQGLTLIHVSKSDPWLQLYIDGWGQWAGLGDIGNLESINYHPHKALSNHPFHELNQLGLITELH